MANTYNIDITSYDTFKKDVEGKGFDPDGVYGIQCFDGANLLWKLLGRSLSSGGTGGAYGTFANVTARVANAGNDFDIITDITQIKRGDVVVFNTTLCAYGHIGYSDGDIVNGSIPILGQNQGGKLGAMPGSEFSVKSFQTKHILGAFRLKNWHPCIENKNPK